SILTDIYWAAIEAVQPDRVVKNHIEIIEDELQKGGYKKLIIIGFGKGACAMALAVEEAFFDKITTGAIITKYGLKGEGLKKIAVYEAAHPVPDDNGVFATRQIVNMLTGLDSQTLVVVLISGGGSAFFVSPLDGVLLSQKKWLTDALMKAGADICELNTVRKHLSNVKGGRLASIAYPARVLSFILSDVIGNRLDVIASGPTAPDTTTYDDAILVLTKYRLIEKVPVQIREILQKGCAGQSTETPKADSKYFQNVTNTIVGSNIDALNGAFTKATELGYETETLSNSVSGEARDVGVWLASKALTAKSHMCLLCAGETTVNVKGAGKGGRNMELALSFAIATRQVKAIALLSAGTDGIDGATDAAGAFVLDDTISSAMAIGLNPEVFLQNNDSYNFFANIGQLFITGQTGTNVMDIQIMLIDKK
ncbi:MAG: glycerate kinase, partial [Candidatus Magnetoovum sp. WYHC-5]|nr:glycerate kinase [Candidatus Magnetoovum sp. WYHC-5]